MTDKLSDNPTPQEAADFFSETDAHKIRRLKSYIKTHEEALSQSRKKVATLEQQLEDARNAVGRADAQIGALIDQTVIYSGAWDELQEALATEEE